MNRLGLVKTRKRNYLIFFLIWRQVYYSTKLSNKSIRVVTDHPRLENFNMYTNLIVCQYNAIHSEEGSIWKENA